MSSIPLNLSALGGEQGGWEPKRCLIKVNGKWWDCVVTEMAAISDQGIDMVLELRAVLKGEAGFNPALDTVVSWPADGQELTTAAQNAMALPPEVQMPRDDQGGIADTGDLLGEEAQQGDQGAVELGRFAELEGDREQ